MKNFIKSFSYLALLVLLGFNFPAKAQDSTKLEKAEKKFWGFFKLPPVFTNPVIQNYRPNDKTGINVFEPVKDTTPFHGIKVKVGGNFTADFQALKDQNNSTPVLVNGVNTNKLMPLGNGFNLPMANLNIDAQLADGIRMEMTAYLSTRHHTDTWVKGGYVQIDKLPFFKSPLLDAIMQNVTVKVGDYEMDYGDEHYRRVDGGNSIYNPFVENYILDDQAVEMGGEVYFHPKMGLIAMFGVTNGELDPTVIKPSAIDTATGKVNKYDASIHGKIGYDHAWNNGARFRLTGSFYVNKSADADPLYFGDRTGSHYFFVMENTAATSDGNAWSGRLNPDFSEQVRSFMVNPFVSYKGLEFFGTYEYASGRMITEPKMRNVEQYAAELVYRFPQRRQNFWIGGRFNAVIAALPGETSDVTIFRGTGSVGWFITKNIALKVEYVNQQYKNFAPTDIFYQGKFDGAMLEATMGF
jgi:hypothetical protein